MGYIYQIKNLENGKKYIGCSSNFSKRITQHKTDLKRGKHINPILQNSFNKNGKDFSKYSFEIIEECKNEILLEREAFHIDSLNTLIPNGYNLCKYGNLQLGIKRRPESIAKFIEKMIGKKKGIKHTKEWCDNISKSLIGRMGNPKTDAQKKAISERNKGKPSWIKGKKHSLEAKMKMSLAHSNRPPDSKETRLKKSLAQRGNKNYHFGKPLSDEHRRKVSESLKGRIFSEQHKIRLKEAWMIRKAA